MSKDVDLDRICQMLFPGGSKLHLLDGDSRDVEQRLRDHINTNYLNKKAVRDILEDELHLAHTTTSGKTSRLTSAIMRIEALNKE